ncbi:mammaglobin-B-like [Saimiri boliviensis]|uniref:mammaglobin-B-like n=1 Tax=Saimiri boliviensis TaxID=27679 RepID=UPI003D76D0BD
MKLLVVLILAALPLYCYAGSGCQPLEDVINKTTDPEVSVPEFQQYLQEFLGSATSEEAVAEFKQCFLNQSNETLKNFDLFMVDIKYGTECGESLDGDLALADGGIKGADQDAESSVNFIIFSGTCFAEDSNIPI